MQRLVRFLLQICGADILALSLECYSLLNLYFYIHLFGTINHKSGSKVFKFVLLLHISVCIYGATLAIL